MSSCDLDYIKVHLYELYFLYVLNGNKFRWLRIVTRIKGYFVFEYKNTLYSIIVINFNSGYVGGEPGEMMVLLATDPPTQPKASSLYRALGKVKRESYIKGPPTAQVDQEAENGNFSYILKL